MVYVFFIHFISLQWLRLLHCPLQSAFHTFVYIQKFRHGWYQQVEHHSVEKQDFFSSFDYKIFRESSFQCQCTVWKKEKFTAMPRNFFSSNQFGTRLKQLVWRNFCYKIVTENSVISTLWLCTHTVDFSKFLYHDFLKNFRENNFFSKEFTI